MPRNAGDGTEGEQSTIFVDGLLLADSSNGGSEVKGRMDIASDRSMIALIFSCRESVY